jgi:ribosomal protein S25
MTNATITEKPAAANTALILAEIKRVPGSTLAWLASDVGITVDLARRILGQLERAGRIKRTWSGAFVAV